jgi:hypothetical protein
MSSQARRWLPLLLVPALLLAACGGDSDDSARAPTPTPEPVSFESLSGDIEAVVKEFASIKSFRAKMTLESPGQQRQSGTLEYVQPDRMRVVFEGTAASGELISIGKDTYLKLGGSWTKLPPSAGAQAFDFQALSNSLADTTAAARATKGGTTTVEGKRCQLYTVTVNADSTEYCVAENRFVRVVERIGTSTITIVFVNYNTSIEIRPPI